MRTASARLRLALSLGTLALVFGAPGRAQTPTFQSLGTLSPFIGSHAAGVSADGAVVVGAVSHTSQFWAFRWTQATGLVALGPGPGGSNGSLATAVSANGAVVVGHFFQNTFASGEAYRWTQATGIVGLGDLPDGLSLSRALAASADGAVVVGMGQSAAGTEAYRWTQATGMVGLGDFSGGSFNSEAADVSADGAVVVGRGQSASGSEAFRWTAASGLVGLGDLPGGTFSSAAAGVSADGAVVVGSGSSGGAGTEAFRWTAATGMVGLGFLPGHDRSEALGVSADGAVVVGVSSTAAERRAFVWTAATGMRDLKTALQADFGLDLTGWTLNAAYAVSDDGTIIVGSGTNTQGAELAYRAGAPFATAAEGEPGPSTGLTLSASRPSPATGDAALTLTLDAAQAVRVEVFDGLGRRVAVLHDGTLGAGAHTLWLDVAALPPGLYVARAAGADGTATRRVTVAR